jgi:DNA replication and repair protein RecF
VIVEQLSLVDFRNYAAADVTLDAGANVFVGRNGQGKTNLAEAIGFFATLGSHRVSQDAPMVRDGADAAIVRMRLAYGERRVMLEAQVNRTGSNKARVNGSPVKTSELPRYAQVVLFAPRICRSSDPTRRRAAASPISCSSSAHRAWRECSSDYDRVLKQRTALLKSARARGIRGEGLSTLDVWDDKLVQLGTDVIRATRPRRRSAGPVARAYTAIAGADHRPRWNGCCLDRRRRPRRRRCRGRRRCAIVLRGLGAEDIQRIFREQLVVMRASELERGLTLVGPHRDDLLLRVRGLPVKGYASHGESWSVALALRLASAELLRAVPAGRPGAHPRRRVRRTRRRPPFALGGLVEGYEQVVVTAAVEEDVPAALRARTVRVVAGTIVAADADGDGDAEVDDE